MTDVLRAQVCVVGCGPAGITVARELVAAGRTVVAVESGRLEEDPLAGGLTEGVAVGPVIKDYPTYLRDSRRAQVGGAGAGWGRAGRIWCIPMQPLDFRERGWVESSGWPVTAEELTPYARRAEVALGLRPFAPATPLAGGALQSYRYQFPRDSGVLGHDFRRLLDDDRFHAETGATVVAWRTSGGRVRGARAMRIDGREIDIEAEAFVLAGGGIENARLLLLEPRLAATTAPIGQHFMEHFHVYAGTVRLPDPEPWRPYLSPSGSADGMEVLGLTPPVQAAERLLNACVQLTPGDDQCSFGVMVRAEQAPRPESRVRLADTVDRLGRRQAHLTWTTTAQDWDSIVRTVALVTDGLATAYGARSDLLIDGRHPWPWPPADPAESARPTWGHHHMGTTRMTADPAQGVVDADGRVHGLSNLYVAGSSVFTTSGFANPTFTIVALSIRLADHLAAVV